MAQLVSKVAPVRPAAASPAPDPMAAANAAIARLANLVATVAQRTEPVAISPALSDFPVPPTEARPTRLEAEVIRDKAGKMHRVVITPVY